MAAISEAAFRSLALQTMDAALDAQRWPALVQALADTCGGMGGLMYGCSLTRPERSFVLNSGFDPDITQVFSERYQDNPWTRAAAAWRGAGAFDSEALVGRRALVGTAFYADVVRPHTPGPGVYTYWDYQRLRFQKRQGMRIDFILGSPGFAERVIGAAIDREERKGAGASDHAPVVVELAEPR